MFAFVVQRLIQAIMVMVSVAFIAFLLFQYVGDPVLFMLGQDATADQIDALRKDLGLDQPFIVQFGHFLLNAVQGEFGISLRQGAKVSQLIADRFPATLELAVIAAGMALLVGIPMGVYAALRRGTLSSQLLMTFSLLGVSLPTFLIGILLILFLRCCWVGCQVLAEVMLSKLDGGARVCSPPKVGNTLFCQPSRSLFFSLLSSCAWCVPKC
jgi:peptide/nickel transport system permease protein